MEASCSKVEITPPIGVSLSGFIARENRPSTSIDAPLYARVLALRSNGQVFILASYDLLGIGAEQEGEVFDAVEKQFAPVVSRERFVLTATHNHSGPPVVHLETEPSPSMEYRQRLIRSTVLAVGKALELLQPADLYAASMEVPELTYNRRALLADGRVSMALQPDEEVVERGPVDNLLSLLVFRAPDGPNVAALAHFACHGVAVFSQAIGSDLPGEIAEGFEKRLGAPCLFLQGTSGDTNPTVVAAGREEMLVWTEKFFATTEGIAGMLRRVQVTGLCMRKKAVPLAYSPLPSVAELSERIAALEQIAEGDVESENVQPGLTTLADIMNFKPGEKPDPSKAAYCAMMLAEAAKKSLAFAQEGAQPPAFPLHLSLLELGEIALVFAAAELFTRTGQTIRMLKEGVTILPVSYAAPLAGYLPDTHAMETGGYEVDGGWQFYGHPAPFRPGSDETVVRELTRMLKESSS